MIHIDFTPEQIDALHHERFHHPHPRVQLKMEAVYLKSQGLPHQDICRLARISENTLRAYLRPYQEGGVERLARTQQGGPRGPRRRGSTGPSGTPPGASWPPTASRWRSTPATTRPGRPPRPPPTSS